MQQKNIARTPAVVVRVRQKLPAATPRNHARGLVPGLLAIALVAGGCSSEAPPPKTESPASSTTRGGDVPSHQPSTAEPKSRKPEPREPLVIAHAPSHGPVRLTERRARAFVNGPAPSWARVLPASQLDASQAVATVGGVDPLVSPDRYPLRTAGPEPGSVTTVRIVGDIMLGRRVAAAHPGDDPAAALRPLADHLAGADLTVGNLESTLSTAGPPTQSPPTDSFSVPPATAAALSDLGIDAVSLANNHTGDYGETALLDTVRRLRAGGLPAFGAGRDLAAASKPVLLKRDGITFGFVGFNAIGETPRATPGSPGAISIRMPPRTGPLNPADLAHALGVVRRLDRKADVVIALPHWGTQYTHVAEPVQTQVGRRLVAAGADLVVGGHPHWVQGLEHVPAEAGGGRGAGGAVVAHSLGNLVFDMDFMEQTMQGVTLTATFWDDRLMRVALAPYRMDASFAPRLAPGPVGRGILSDVWQHSAGPFRSD